MVTYSGPAQTFQINGGAVEQVTQFCYLDSNILPDRQARDEIPHPISQARAAPFI